jgi:hypothetical protein
VEKLCPRCGGNLAEDQYHQRQHQCQEESPVSFSITELPLADLDAATLTGGTEVNVLIDECHSSWIGKLFEPQEGEFFTRVPIEMTWAHLLAYLQCFPSISQARKNGWDKDIPEGWSEVTIGKARRLRIYVLKGNEDVRSCLREGCEGNTRTPCSSHG